MARMTMVEVKKWHGDQQNRAFGWHQISVEDGLRLRDERFRCPECLGRV